MTQRATEPSPDSERAAREATTQDGRAPQGRLRKPAPLYDPLKNRDRGIWVVAGAAVGAALLHVLLVNLGLAMGGTTLTRMVVFETVTMFQSEEAPKPPEPEPEPVAVAEPEPAPEPEPEPTEEPEPEPPPQDFAPLGAPGGPSADGLASGGPGGIPLLPGSGGSGAAPRARREEAPPPEPEPHAEPAREPRRPVRLEDAGTPPHLTNADPAMDYPAELRERAVAGVVVVQCIITENGHVRACRQRSGPDELAEYVISVVRHWQYDPALDHRGDAIAVAYTYRVPFRLL